MSDRVQALVRVVCDILGLACISAAGFLLPWWWAESGWVGFLLLGLSVFVLNWRLNENPARGSA